MWPWGHLAVGYLLYSLGLRRVGRRPAAVEVVLLAIGTQFPDLVDKPLAWELGLLASGRSLAHSVLVAAVVLAALYVVLTPRIGRAPVVAFAVGWLSHPLADFPLHRVLAGEYEFTTYFVWPLLSLPPYETNPSLLGRLAAFELGLFEILQLGLFVLAAALWYRDGQPGWGEAKQAVRRGRAEAPRR